MPISQKTEILTVVQLTLTIKQHLEGHFSAITVQGEVSNIKEQPSGHIYFTLKDAEAQISAVLFKGNARGLSKIPKNGDQIIIKGEINVYLPRGTYQIIVRELTYSGVGALLLKLHEMKLKLQERGWFDKASKKPLPKYPKTIGVVTSSTGSVIQDILHILTRRFSGFHLILNPVKVQGEGAALEIARAIDQFNQHKLADVLIIGRGGGSLEDLWAFNEEIVASAVFRSQIPIICAVGHETDYCIADFVADMRAPTPSAAAELVTSEKAHQLHFLTQVKERMKNTMRTLLQHIKKQLEQVKRHPYLSSPYLFLAPHIQRIDDLTYDLNLSLQRSIQEKYLKLSSVEGQVKVLNPKNQIIAARNKIGAFSHSLLVVLKNHFSVKFMLINPIIWQKKFDLSLFKHIAEKKERLSQLIAHLKGIDPKALLTKGYCLLFKEKLVQSVADLEIHDKVHILLHDGKAHLTVDKVE